MEASQSKSTYKDIDVINEETESVDPLERPTSARKRSANTGSEVFELLEHQRGPESQDETPGESIRRVQSFEERQLKKNGWWDLWGYEEFGSELLENNGAVARDHVGKSLSLKCFGFILTLCYRWQMKEPFSHGSERQWQWPQQVSA